MIALTAIPVANVVAADVSTIPLIQSKWFGTGLNYDNEGAIIVNPSGDPIMQTVGNLVKGTYVFKYNFLETDGSAIVIEVGGAKKTVEADQIGKGELEFTLSSQQEVKVTISSAENKAFMIGDMVVELRFDFDQAIADLKKKSDNALNVIKVYKGGKRADDDQNKVNFYDLIEGGAVDQMIQEIVDNPDYDTYAKYELWDIDENPIVAKIEESADKAAYDEDVWEWDRANELLRDLREAQEEIDGLSEYSQPALNKLCEQIKNDVQAYKDAIEKDQQENKAPAYDYDEIHNDPTKYLAKYKELQKRIEDLNKAIQAAKDANNANDAAYNALKAQLDDARKSYNANRNELEEYLSDATYDYWFGDTEEAGKYDRFKQLLEDALKEMDVQANILRQLYKENDQKHTEGTSVENQADLYQKIWSADKELDIILAKYKNRLEIFFKALQAKIDEQAKLNAELALHNDVDIFYIDDKSKKATYNINTWDNNPKTINDLQKLINDLVEKIDAANNASDPDPIYNTLEKLDITADLAAIDAAFDALQKQFTTDQENLDCLSDLVDQYNQLYTNYSNSVDDAKALEYDPAFGTRKPYDKKYKGKYETASNSLKKQLDKIKNSIEAQRTNYFEQTTGNPYRTNGPVKSKVTIEKNMSDWQTDLDATNKNLIDEYNWYNHLAEVVSSGNEDYIGYEADLHELYEAIKDLDIYKTHPVMRNGEIVPDPESPVKGNTYEEKVNTIQAQIQAIKDEINKYWNNGNLLDIPYGTAIMGIADDASPVSIKDQIQALRDNYQKDQDRYDQIQASLALEALYATVQAQISDATKRLDDIRNAKDTAPFTEEIQKQCQELQDVLDAIVKEVNESGYEAALASDADIEDDIAVIATLTKISEEKLKELKNNSDPEELDITMLEEFVEDAQANFAANKELNDLWNEVNSDLAKAKADAAKEDPDAGTNYWLDELNEMGDELNGIKDNMDDRYNAMESVQYKDGITEQLKDLQDEINGVKQRVINNLDCYEGDAAKGIKGLLAYEQEVQDAFDDVTFKIASVDISTQRDEYEAELTGKKNELIRLTNSIRDRYENGEYDQGKTDPQYTEDVLALTLLKSEIEQILTKHQSEYYDNVYADNKIMIEAIMRALQEAQRRFNEANATLTTYDDLETVNLQEAVEKAKAEAERLNQDIKKWPDIIHDLSTQILHEWEELIANNKGLYDAGNQEDMERFDKDGDYLDLINDYTLQIKDRYTEFINNVAKAFNDVIKADVEYAQNQFNEATKSISGYGNDLYNVTGKSSDKNYFNNWFNKPDKNGDKGIKDLWAEALDLANETSNAQMYIKRLDIIMSQLSKENVDRRILTLKNEAADKVESEWLRILQQEVKDGEAWIAQVHDDNPNKQAWIDEFAKEVEENVDPAQALYDENYEKVTEADEAAGLMIGDMTGDLPGVYNQIKAYYNKFHNNNRYTKLKNSYDQFVKETNALKNAQSELDKAIAEVEKYEVSGQEKEKYLNDIQKTIDERLAAAEEALRAGNAASLKGNANDLINKINQVKGQYLYEDEYAQLLEDIKIVEQELNRFSNDMVHDDGYSELHKLVDQYQAELDKIKSDLSTAYTNNKPSKSSTYKPSALLPFEKRIAELLVKINNANDAAQAQRVVALLNGKIAELEAKAKTLQEGEYDQEVRDKYQTDIDRANAEIEKVKKIVSDNAAQIMFYRDKAEDEMAAIDKWLDNVIAKANADQQALVAKRAANDLAFTTLNGQLDELRQKIADSQAKVDLYEHTKSTDYSNQYGLVTAQIEQEAGIISDQHDAVELDATSKISDDLVKYVDNKIIDIENTAANREISFIVADLQNQAARLLFTESQYTLLVWKEMQEEIESIKEDIEDLEDDVKDAKANLKSDAELEGQKAEAAAIQKRIDELKAKAEREVINKASQGDVTGDGEVSVSDYRQVLGYVLNGAPEKGTPEYAAADVNKDGEVNSGDLVAITNIILYGDPKGEQAQEARGHRSIETVSAEATEGRVALKLDNSLSYAAGQFDVILPAGASIKASLAARAEKFELNTAKNEDGSVRVVISSVLNRIMEGNTGAVVYLDVEGANGSELSFDNIIFTDNHANAKKFDAILGEATAIESVSAETAESTEAYNLGGRMMNTLKKGVNIIRDAAGKMKKVVVK